MRLYRQGLLRGVLAMNQNELNFEIFGLAKGQASGVIGILALCFIAFLVALVIIAIAPQAIVPIFGSILPR